LIAIPANLLLPTTAAPVAGSIIPATAEVVVLGGHIRKTTFRLVAGFNQFERIG
jgi:hypothetical protein